MQGWVKIHRELLKKPIWLLSTPQQKSILITILLMANHEEKEWEWKGERYVCQPGQVVTSLDKIAKKSGKGISIQNVRTALSRFEKYEFLTNESTSQNRLITICNWEQYQENENGTNKDTNNQLTDDQQTPNKQLTTNKNDKNYKNDKNTTIDDSGESNDKVKNIDYSAIVELYHTKCPSFPRILKMSDTRKQKIKIRLEEMGGDMKLLESIFEKMESSKYLRGESKSGWKASFDWVFKNQENWVKIAEGNYSDNNKPNGNSNSEVNKIWQ